MRFIIAKEARGSSLLPHGADFSHRDGHTVLFGGFALIKAEEALNHLPILPYGVGAETNEKKATKLGKA